QLFARVAGDQVYEVEARRDGNIVLFYCGCPNFAKSREICQHAWATITAGTTRGFLDQTTAGSRLRLRAFADPELGPTDHWWDDGEGEDVADLEAENEHPNGA